MKAALAFIFLFALQGCYIITPIINFGEVHKDIDIHLWSRYYDFPRVNEIPPEILDGKGVVEPATETAIKKLLPKELQ